jgi:hypothetical protein
VALNHQPGVYDCQWGTDVVRVIVAGELPREPCNAPLHLFSAAPDLVGFGSKTYQRRSGTTSLLLGQLSQRLRGEGTFMAYTMADSKRDCFLQLSKKEKRELLQTIPTKELLAALSPEQIRAYLDQQTAEKSAKPRKPRRKS